LQPLPALFGHAKLISQNTLRRSGSQQYHYLRLNRIDLHIQPGPASADFQCVGLLVQAAFTARLPFEMLHDVGHVDVISINAGSSQSFIKDGARRSYKWPALQIFLIAGLFAHSLQRCDQSAMHITAGVYVNDDERGLIQDIDKWLEQLAPFKEEYLHHETGEDNGDSHLKALLVHHQVILPVTNGKLLLGTWQRVFYAEFDGQRAKRVVVIVMGE